MKEIINLYPETKNIDIGKREDNDPPIFEKINLYKISNSYISTFGYIIYNFQILKQGISYRHRNSVSFKNVLSFILFKRKISIDNACLSIANGWVDSYYHFTLECLPKLYLMRDFIETSTLVFPSKLTSFHKQWFDILDIHNIQLINDDEIVKTKLAITSNFSARDLNHHHLITPHFRDWVLSKIQQKNIEYNKKIFIGRKNPKYRVLLNKEDVIKMLNKYGFVYIEMEDFTVVEQILIFNNAQQIVSIHGAALSNICFCKPNTKIIDLMHEDFKQWCFLKLAIILNLSYSIIPCKDINQNDKLPGHRNLLVDINVLEKFIKTW